MSDDLRFPIGDFNWPASISAADREDCISRIASTPSRLRAVLSGLSTEQLDTPYREGGWTLRQVAHHVPDSHINSYVRFKLALTEGNPTIKPYDEAAWARLSDSVDTPVETSLCLLDCLHQRWVALLRGMTEAEWKKTFQHPEVGPVSLEKNLALYAWHGDHHIAHVAGLRNRLAW
jgi:DinB superfamily